MSRKKLIVVGLVLLSIVLVLYLNYVTISPPVSTIEPEPIKPALPNPYVEKLLASYEAEILDMLRKTRTPGLAIAIVQDSTILFMKGYGLREVGTHDSVDVNTVFRLASVSKCFAPLLTGLLVQDGILRWNDRVVEHVPQFKLKASKNTDSLKLYHVLSHTTGLPYHTYTTLVEDGRPLEDMLGELQKVNPIAMPGEVYSYQNVAYSIIAAVIRSATERSYEQEMRERVFVPLEMNDASMSFHDIMANGNVAKPHLHWRKGWKATGILDTYYNVGPAGGVNASISDMAMFLTAMLGAKRNFVEKTTLDKIFEPVVKARSKNRYFRKWVGRSDSHYALGWRVLNFGNDTLYYHGGYVKGYRSEIALDRTSRIGICVLTNGPGRLIDNSVPIFFNMFYNRRDSILQWQNEQERLAKLPLTRNDN